MKQLLALTLLFVCSCGTPAGNDGGTGGGAAGGGATGGGGGTTGGGTTGGGGATGGGATGGGAPLSFEPMSAGRSWTYDTSDPLNDGGVSVGSKIVTAEALEAVPGKPGTMAWRIRTLVPGSQIQLTWQEEQPDAIVRHRDDTFLLDGGAIDSTLYEPWKLRLQTTAMAVMTNATYSEGFQQTTTVPGMAPMVSTKSISWRVINGAEQVTVPAGTFTAVHIQKQSGMTPDKDYWFVAGIGKVKETAMGSGRVELLRAHSP